MCDYADCTLVSLAPITKSIWITTWREGSFTKLKLCQFTYMRLHVICVSFFTVDSNLWNFRMIYQFTLVKGSGRPPNKALYEYICKYYVFESRFSLESFVYSDPVFSAYYGTSVYWIWNLSPGINKVISSGSAWDLHSDGFGFEYQPAHRLSSLRL